MEYLEKVGGSDKSRQIPPKPSINNERQFIAWMIRYDDDLAFVREMFGDNLDDSFIESTVTENIRILGSCQGGHALFDKLTLIAKRHQDVLHLIKQRGGLAYSPSEIQALYIDLTIKITILPCFVKYKYGIDLPSDIFG